MYCSASPRIHRPRKYAYTRRANTWASWRIHSSDRYIHRLHFPIQESAHDSNRGIYIASVRLQPWNIYTSHRIWCQVRARRPPSRSSFPSSFPPVASRPFISSYIHPSSHACICDQPSRRVLLPSVRRVPFPVPHDAQCMAHILFEISICLHVELLHGFCTHVGISWVICLYVY